jgi:hypothetical protein
MPPGPVVIPLIMPPELPPLPAEVIAFGFIVDPLFIPPEPMDPITIVETFPVFESLIPVGSPLFLVVIGMVVGITVVVTASHRLVVESTNPG